MALDNGKQKSKMVHKKLLKYPVITEQVASIAIPRKALEEII